jgi:hypothetical protein
MKQRVPIDRKIFTIVSEPGRIRMTDSNRSNLQEKQEPVQEIDICSC